MYSASKYSTILPVWLLMGIVVSILSWDTSYAQSNTSKADIQSETELTVEYLTRQTDSLNQRKDLDSGVLTRTKTYFEEAIKQLKNAAHYEAQTILYKASLQNIPKELKEIKAEIDSVKAMETGKEISVYAQTPPHELEQLLIVEQATLKELEAAHGILENQSQELVLRPAKIRSALQEAIETLESINQVNETRIMPDAPSTIETEGRRALRKATKKALSSKKLMLEHENLSHAQRLEKLNVQRELVSFQIEQTQVRIDGIEQALEKRRESEAETFQKQLEKKLQAASGKHRILQEEIRRNMELGHELVVLDDRVRGAAKQKEKTGSKISQIKEEFKSAQSKIALAGLSPALGAILRNQYRNLPNTTQIAQQLEAIREKTADIGLKQLQIEERMRITKDAGTLLESLITLNVDDTTPANEKIRIKAELRVLLTEQKELLQKINQSYRRYLLELGEIDFLNTELTKVAKRYQGYLSERLLWIPSSPPISAQSGFDLMRAALWVTSPANWTQTLNDFYTGISDYSLATTLVLLVIFALLFLRHRLIQRMGVIKDRVSKLYSDRFGFTGEALLYTLMFAAPLPLLMIFSGWILSTTSASSEFSRAIGIGLIDASVPLIFLQVFYRIFAVDGIAMIHFGWRSESVAVFRHQIAWLRFVAVLAIFIIAVAASQHDPTINDSLGRLALIVTMVAMAIIFATILNPRGNVLKKYFLDHPTNWITRFRRFWFILVILVPIIVIGFAVNGYYISALQFQQKLISTIRIIFVVLVVHQLIIRWLSLANRKLALKKAREKRELQASTNLIGGSGAPSLQIAVDELDIPTIETQTHQTVSVIMIFSIATALWWVWHDIFPALGILDGVVLWHHSEIVDGLETVDPITLTNLALVIVYLFIGFILIRNLPGILEIVIFRRLDTDPGSRYAVNQLARYAIVAIGTIIVAEELGGDWSQVQWLVAALGVGLGFGLQEIFANFISGIILLFERPLRLGDTVTVGDITGTVSRIQIRATTLADWDRRELVVPNKTFVTGQMINWTLSDPVTRLKIPVGIAYGSDTAKAHEVIKDIVGSSPLVLNEPEPTVYFVGFGDSSLNFEIRAFVNSMEDRLPTTHELHIQIDQALRKHGIEIPFPQRDIHIRSVESNDAKDMRTDHSDGENSQRDKKE